MYPDWAGRIQSDHEDGVQRVGRTWMLFALVCVRSYILWWLRNSCNPRGMCQIVPSRVPSHPALGTGDAKVSPFCVPMSASPSTYASQGDFKALLRDRLMFRYSGTASFAIVGRLHVQRRQRQEIRIPPAWPAWTALREFG